MQITIPEHYDFIPHTSSSGVLCFWICKNNPLMEIGRAWGMAFIMLSTWWVGWMGRKPRADNFELKTGLKVVVWYRAFVLVTTKKDRQVPLPLDHDIQLILRVITDHGVITKVGYVWEYAVCGIQAATGINKGSNLGYWSQQVRCIDWYGYWEWNLHTFPARCRNEVFGITRYTFWASVLSNWHTSFCCVLFVKIYATWFYVINGVCEQTDRIMISLFRPTTWRPPCNIFKDANS